MMKYWVIFSLSLMMASCVKNTTETLDLEIDKLYFPLQIGKYREYRVDSILYRQGKYLDSISTMMREEIISSGRDTSGDYFILLRSFRKMQSEPWTPVSSLTARIKDYKLIINNSNQATVSLVFPIEAGTSWDAMALIKGENVLFDVAGESVEIYNKWGQFKIKETPKSLQIGTFKFDLVTTVISSNDDQIDKRSTIDQYAKGIGLVYRETEVYKCDSNVNSCFNITLPWGQRATKGFKLRQTITAYN